MAETFARVARLLLAEEGVKPTLAKIGQLAVETIDGCDHAGAFVAGPVSAWPKPT